MNKRFWFTLLAVLLVASMALSACQPAATEAPPEEPEPEMTEEVAEPEEPAAPEDAYADVDPSGQTVSYWHQHSRG
jgi:multiple sugar transport system substrate-binding protein/sn-glycerol 3-phosphate transport system substrate-binding protein